MNKKEFLSKLPDILNHKTRGYGELEIVVDEVGHKGVCYRHNNRTASLGTYGSSWLEVYEALYKDLVFNGYVLDNKN